ncbi:hypothetical protein, partial [Duncaniella muris]
LRKISASQNNSENKSSVGSVSGLAKTEQPQILPNHCTQYMMQVAIFLLSLRMDTPPYYILHYIYT